MGRLLIKFSYFEEGKFSPQMFEFLKKPLSVYYNDMTTIGNMLKYVCRTAPIDIKNGYDKCCLLSRFMLYYKGEYKEFKDLDSNLFLLLNYIGEVNGEIVLDWDDCVRGGAAAMEQNGLLYFFHSNESNHLHTPHVHVSYAEEEVSIKILDCSVLAGNIKRSKLKEAKSTIERKRAFFYDKWNECTNGFDVQRFYCPKGAKEPICEMIG